MNFDYTIKGTLSADSLEIAREIIKTLAEKAQATSVDIHSKLDDECIILKRRTVV